MAYLEQVKKGKTGLRLQWCLLGLLTTLTAGCNQAVGTSTQLSNTNITQYDVSSLYKIEYLTGSSYHFPSIYPDTHTTIFQELERFDLIFVGYDRDAQATESDVLNLASIIPGTYTHMLAYIGKDSEGFAYGIEMNSSEDQSYSFGIDGLKLNGKLYVYCLGSDFGEHDCPEDDHFYGLEFYDFMVAKKLRPELKASLMAHEDELIATIKRDLINEYLFQLPFHIGFESLLTGVIPIVDDGRVNGSDCAAYLSSLFEEVSGVCLDDSRITASEIEAYYLSDPVGREALIPARYNFLTDDGADLLISEALTTHGYSIVNNRVRETACADEREVTGMPTPDRMFNSPSLY
jgi:hypothetical protein